MRPASLPMYDTDPAAVQAWWTGIAGAMQREGMTDVPPVASWPDDLDDHWRDPALLLSQTCGYPLVTQLGDFVQVLGAFRYTAPGCSGTLYRSELVVRSGEPGRGIEDFRGRVAAISDPHSHSGCHALRARVAPLAQRGRFFAAEAEFAALRRALGRASTDPGLADVRRALFIDGFEVVPAAAWVSHFAVLHGPASRREAWEPEAAPTLRGCERSAKCCSPAAASR